MHELKHMASLLKSLLERGWNLPLALHTSWLQVTPFTHPLAHQELGTVCFKP